MRLMLFGDSHLAALKTGYDHVERPEGLDVSFWGTAGVRFRHISWRNGRVEPNDEQTARAFSRFNGDGLELLDPADYDAVAFVGARIRPGAVLPDLLNVLAHPTRHLSRTYIQLVLAEHYLKHTTYSIARKMAAQGKTRVLMNLVPLETHGKAPTPRQFKVARQAEAEHLQYLWDLTSEFFGQDGITFVPQPLDTIVDGYYTDARYGLENEDSVHKNTEYGARILSEIYKAVA